MGLADVLEVDKPNPQSLGKILRVGGKYSYHDLDELIVTHVKAIVRKMEELMNHEKFKGKTQEELGTCFVFAYASRSIDTHSGGFFFFCA